MSKRANKQNRQRANARANEARRRELEKAMTKNRARLSKHEREARKDG